MIVMMEIVATRNQIKKSNLIILWMKNGCQVVTQGKIRQLNEII
jgi:hypothetical protein